LYAIAPSPVTLILLKQIALALSALPLYGIAKVYFRKGSAPVLFAALYLISPLTMAIDWNSFDPEAFLPLAVLGALYFFAKGRFWPFMLCWILALGTIEAAPPLLILFAAGGLLATFVVQSSTPYLTALQQRRPLLIALLVAGAWLAIAYFALQLAGPRGGAFGNSYATRYTVLGATSFPDVLPRALTHPGAAAAALQFDGSEKLLFLGLLILATGAFSLLGGLRYLLPFAGYLTLAFLSNNAGLYIFGTQYAALIFGILFAAAIEGTVLVVDFLGISTGDQRRHDLETRLISEARDLGRRLPPSIQANSTRRQLSDRLQRAVTLLGRGELGPAERELERSRREIEAHSQSRVTNSVSSLGGDGKARAVGRSRLVALRSRTRFLLKSVGTTDAVVLAILAVCVLSATAVANPLIGEPLDRSSTITYGLAGPNADDQVLHSVLQLIPAQASVLTTPHLFPELSSRHDAYVVVNGAFLRGNETIAGDLSAWSNQSNFVAIDYRVDPTAAFFYQYYLSETGALSEFGLYAAEDGAYLYERGWHEAPSFWMPWTTTLAGSQLTIFPGNKTSPAGGSILGTSLFHDQDPTGWKKGPIWAGPGMLYLPPGNYSVSFNLDLYDRNRGSQLLLQATAAPANITDNVTLTTGQEKYHTILIKNDLRPYHSLGNYTVSANNTTKLRTWTLQTVTFSFQWNSTGYVSFPGTYLSRNMSLYLLSIQVLQQPFPGIASSFSDTSFAPCLPCNGTATPRP
jgi:uncharacterized membrane protein